MGEASSTHLCTAEQYAALLHPMSCSTAIAATQHGFCRGGAGRPIPFLILRSHAEHGVSKDGGLHDRRPRPSFETHRSCDAPQSLTQKEISNLGPPQVVWSGA